MSTVKPQGDLAYPTTTPDSLKVSSPKALGDPSGSSDRVDLFQTLSSNLLFANCHIDREYWFCFPMVFVKKFPRKLYGSAVATSSAPVPGVYTHFVAVMCSAPGPGVYIAVAPAEFQDPLHSHLFRHRGDSFVSRHSAESTASTSSSESHGASRSCASAEYLVSVHTLSLLHSLIRYSTLFTASTCCAPISPPVIVNMTSGASRAVAGCMDLVHSYHFLKFTDHVCLQLVSMKNISRQFIRSTTSTGYTLIAPPDDVLLVYRASQTVLYVVSLDSIISPFFIDSVVCSEDIWLALKTVLMFRYGASPRPPEICFASCLWRRFFTLVCLWSQSSFSHCTVHSHLSIDVAILRTLEIGCLDITVIGHLSVDDVLRSLDSIDSFRQGEFGSESFKWHIVFDITRRWLALWLDYPGFTLTESGSMLHSPLVMNWITLSMLLHHGYTRSFVATQDYVTTTSPSQNRDYGFTGHLIVSRSPWLVVVLEFLYGSQPRPPDVLFFMFYFSSILQVFMSKMKVHLLTFILRGSIRYLG